MMFSVPGSSYTNHWWSVRPREVELQLADWSQVESFALDLQRRCIQLRVSDDLREQIHVTVAVTLPNGMRMGFPARIQAVAPAGQGWRVSLELLSAPSELGIMGSMLHTAGMNSQVHTAAAA